MSDAAFATFAGERPDAVFIGQDPFLNSRRLQLSMLAMRHAIPAAYSGREYAEVGGLMTYGSNIADAYREVGVYVGRILWVCEDYSDRPWDASAVGCFLNCANTYIIRLLEDSASGTANKLQIQSISSAS